MQIVAFMLAKVVAEYGKHADAEYSKPAVDGANAEQRQGQDKKDRRAAFPQFGHAAIVARPETGANR